MAYMNQERKAAIAAELRKVVPAGWKYTLAVRNRSTIVMTIREAPVDLLQEVVDRVSRPAPPLQYRDRSQAILADRHVVLNQYCLRLQLDASLETFEAITAALNKGNHNRSDIQTDYFDVGWYVDLQIGTWDKPFKSPAKEIA